VDTHRRGGPEHGGSTMLTPGRLDGSVESRAGQVV